MMTLLHSGGAGLGRPLQLTREPAVMSQVAAGLKGLRRPGNGFHSLCSNVPVIINPAPTAAAGGRRQKYTETVIFDMAQALPVYPILYAT